MQKLGWATEYTIIMIEWIPSAIFQNVNRNSHGNRTKYSLEFVSAYHPTGLVDNLNEQRILFFSSTLGITLNRAIKIHIFIYLFIFEIIFVILSAYFFFIIYLIFLVSFITVAVYIFFSCFFVISFQHLDFLIWPQKKCDLWKSIWTSHSWNGIRARYTLCKEAKHADKEANWKG